VRAALTFTEAVGFLLQTPGCRYGVYCHGTVLFEAKQKRAIIVTKLLFVVPICEEGVSVKKLIGLLVLVSVLTGCGTTKPQSNIVSGTVLSWHNVLYKVVSPRSADMIGNRLGTVSYHGRVSGEFTVFQLAGTDPAKGLVFESSDGHYFKAIATSGVQ
jgi:hypothetical protein